MKSLEKILLEVSEIESKYIKKLKEEELCNWLTSILLETVEAKRLSLNSRLFKYDNVVLFYTSNLKAFNVTTADNDGNITEYFISIKDFLEQEYRLSYLVNLNRTIHMDEDDYKLIGYNLSKYILNWIKTAESKLKKTI